MIPPRIGRALAAILLFLGSAAGRSGATAPARPPDLAPAPFACEACQPPEGAPVRELGAAEIDSIGRSLSHHNLNLWVRTDSLYRAGSFGRVGSDEARTGARLHFMVRAWSGFDYLTQLVGRSAYLRSDEQGLVVPFGQTYSNTAVYPLHRLKAAWVGPSGFCTEYDLETPINQHVLVGGVDVHVHSDLIRPDDGTALPGLCLEMASSMHSSIDLLYGSRHCGRVRQEMIVDRGDTLDLVTVSDIEGLHARKAGTHQLSAVIVWRSRVQGDRDPARPRIGACAYFPRIQIKLSLLPDLGLDDLRDFDVPQPIVATEWARKTLQRDWIRVKQDAILSPWEAVGPRPAVIAERFPDL